MVLLESWALVRLGHEGEHLMNGICAVIKKRLQRALFLFLLGEDVRYMSQEAGPHDTKSSGT